MIIDRDRYNTEDIEIGDVVCTNVSTYLVTKGIDSGYAVLELINFRPSKECSSIKDLILSGCIPGTIERVYKGKNITLKLRG